MRYSLKKPCKECPYTKRMPGWIGDHASAREFHELSQLDILHPCHMTVNGNAIMAEPGIVEGKEERQCAGQAMYMNSRCKLSKNHRMAQYQSELRGREPVGDLMTTPEELVEFHRR